VSILPARMVFYASVVPLVAFYAFFASALYPASVYLHPHGFYSRMAPLVPIGLHGLLKVSCLSCFLDIRKVELPGYRKLEGGSICGAWHAPEAGSALNAAEPDRAYRCELCRAELRAWRSCLGDL